MRKVKALVRWKSIVGLLAIGVLAFSLTLEGAPTRKEGTRKRRPTELLRSPNPMPASSTEAVGLEPKDEVASPVAADANEPGSVPQKDEGFVLYGNVGGTALPVAKAVVVNPYDDFASKMRRRGELIGPYRPQRLGGVAGTGCSFNVECDDCDPCTLDLCIIAQGAPPGSGTCDNSLIQNGLVGECSDGLFCNGIETCQNGTCEAIGAGTGAGGPDCTGGQICDEFQNDCVTPCTQSQCNSASDNPGALCVSNGQCPNGACLLTPEAVCDDLVLCNGTETCGLDGICQPGTDPCGPGADCTESRCTGASGDPCQIDDDCPTGQTCTATGPGCYFGRCCTGGDGLNCVEEKHAGCLEASGEWYSGDTGRAAIEDGTQCLEDGMGCPRYSSGIAPQGDFNFDEITVMSDSICRASDDGGGDGFDDYVDVVGRRGAYRLGDDYEMIGDPGYVAVESLRWVGGYERDFSDARVVFEFYDENENFVEDVFVYLGGAQFAAPNAIRPVFFDPPLTLPTRGFVVAGTASHFGPNGAVRWLSTDAVDQGANNPNLMWLEDENNAGPIAPAGGSFDFNVDEVPSSGILAFEFVGDLLVDAPVGACCDLATGKCLDNLEEWVCKAGTCSISATTCVDSSDCPTGETCLKRTTLGAGSFCATCNLDSGDRTFMPCRRCNDGAACDNDDQCVGHGGTEECLPSDAYCQGGSGAGGSAACEATTTCATGACCNTLTGACTPGQTSCGANEEFLGFGTDCDPDCCRQPEATWSGGDNCEDAIVHQFTVPDPTSLSCNGTGIDCTGNPGVCGGDPCVPTRVVAVITGDNSNATSTAENPDSCTFQQFNPNADPSDFDPGWWEGFHIDECALVTIDNCCTDPRLEPEYRVITEDCPCLTSGFIFSNNQARGAPICADDNLWSTYGPLHPGTYYFPTYSNLAGTFGEYQLHITVEACPEVACCYLACDRDPPELCPGGTCSEGVCVAGICRVPCSGPDTECTPDTCEPRCDVLNQFGCNEVGGVFLGPPIKEESTSTCVQSKPICTSGQDPFADDCCDPFGIVNCGTCQIGSCCTAPGVCDDFEPDSYMTKDICDGKPGTYYGGYRCHGGHCSVATNRSCSVDADCPIGNTCVITTAEAREPNPCPVCEIDNTTSCRYTPQSEGGFTGGIIYTINGDPFRVADDFKPLGSEITTICWNPGFYNFSTGEYCQTRCDQPVGETYPDDGWQVTVYPDNGSGLPDEANGETRTINVQAKEDAGFSCIYSGTVSPAIPVNEGGCYWIEITGTAAADGCTPLWLGNIAGNRFSLQDGDGAYGYEDALADDMTFCLDCGMDNAGPDCGPVEGACCKCPASQGAPPLCSEGSFADCDDIQGRFQFGVASCPGNPADLCSNGPGPEDNCATRMVVTSSPADPDLVVVPVDTFCAFTDGPTDVLCEGATAVEFKDDVWYEYVATCTDDLKIDTCSDNNNFDAVMQVYVNEADPTQCGCPGDPNIVPLGACSDANGTECPDNTDAAMRIAVEEGNCYTVRVGGQTDLLGFSEGVLDLTFECGAAVVQPEAPDPCPNDFANATNPSNGQRLSRFGCLQSLAPPVVAGAGVTAAIKVGLKTVYNTSPGDPDGADACPPRPPTVNKPNLHQFEGGVRYLGAPAAYFDDASPQPLRYIAAPLVCTPEEAAVRDWSPAALAADFPPAPDPAHPEILVAIDPSRIYFWGDTVVPCSVYELSACSDPANDASCSTPATLYLTAKPGDAWAPKSLLGEPGFIDINSIVNKYKGIPFQSTPPSGGPPEWHAFQNGNAFDLGGKTASFLDISAGVDGYKGLPYKEQGPCSNAGTDSCGNPCDTDPN